MQPFDLLEHDDPNLLDRLTGSRPKRNAYVELHNLLAAAEHVGEFGPESLRRIGRAHGVDLTHEFLDERRTLYARYLTHCLSDGALTEDERHRIVHLARTLALDANDLAPIHDEIYGKTVSDALTDDCLSVEERLLLYAMQHTLGLDPDHAAAVYDAEARSKLLRRVAYALCDGELSEEERADIDALAAATDVEIPIEVQGMMESARYRWTLRHDDLPEIELPLRLLDGEAGHFAGAGTWFELNYARLRVDRSDYEDDLQHHRTAHITVPKSALDRLDAGSIYVTDRRFVLSGGRLKPTVLRFSALLGTERYRNGVRVLQKGDRSLFVQSEGEPELFHLALSRALKAY